MDVNHSSCSHYPICEVFTSSTRCEISAFREPGADPDTRIPAMIQIGLNPCRILGVADLQAHVCLPSSYPTCFTLPVGNQCARTEGHHASSTARGAARRAGDDMIKILTMMRQKSSWHTSSTSPSAKCLSLSSIGSIQWSTMYGWILSWLSAIVRSCFHASYAILDPLKMNLFCVFAISRPQVLAVLLSFPKSAHRDLVKTQQRLVRILDKNILTFVHATAHINNGPNNTPAVS